MLSVLDLVSTLQRIQVGGDWYSVVDLANDFLLIAVSE